MMSVSKTLGVGMLVVPIGLPAALRSESTRVFQRSLGNTIRIDAIQQPEGGDPLFGLNVDERGHQGTWCEHTIYFEAACLRPASLLELLCYLPNGLHDFHFERVHEGKGLLQIEGTAWIGDLGAPPGDERERGRSLRLEFSEPNFIACEGCEPGKLDEVARGRGEIWGSDPVGMFCSAANAICWFRASGFVATLAELNPQPRGDSSKSPP